MLRLAFRFGFRLVLLGGLAAMAAPAGAAPSLENAVKAAYLYKFAPFVSWRASAFDGPSSPMFLCVQGDDPFGNLLDRVAAGQKIGGRPVVVRRIGVVAQGSRCHLLYVAGSKLQPTADALQAVKGEPVLTVTDAGRPSPVKGMVHFVVVGNRVRFEVDNAEAAASGLQISSKLQALAIGGRP